MHYKELTVVSVDATNVWFRFIFVHFFHIISPSILYPTDRQSNFFETHFGQWAKQFVNSYPKWHTYMHFNKKLMEFQNKNKTTFKLKSGAKADKPEFVFWYSEYVFHSECVFVQMCVCVIYSKCKNMQVSYISLLSVSACMYWCFVYAPVILWIWVGQGVCVFVNLTVTLCECVLPCAVTGVYWWCSQVAPSKGLWGLKNRETNKQRQECQH